MNGWMDGLVDGWMVERVDGLMHRWMGIRTARYKEKWIERGTDGWK